MTLSAFSSSSGNGNAGDVPFASTCEAMETQDVVEIGGSGTDLVQRSKSADSSTPSTSIEELDPDQFISSLTPPLPSQDLQFLLHTNDPPRPHTLPALHTHSTALSHTASALSTSISQLEDELAMLTEKRERLRAAAKPFEALGSAFRRFPPELMQCIFMHCLPCHGGGASYSTTGAPTSANGGCGTMCINGTAGCVGSGASGSLGNASAGIHGGRKGRNAVMHASEAPLLLGRICSRWRRIVMHTPALWCSLHIVPPNYIPESSTLPMSLFAPPGGVAGHHPVLLTAAGPTPTAPSPSSTLAVSTAAECETSRIQTNQTRFLQKCALIRTWLDRSGTCPLSLSFVWFHGESAEELALCALLLDVLTPLSRRWRHLDFQVPLRVLRAPFGGLRKEDVGMLESFEVTDNRTTFDDSAASGGQVRWPEGLEFARDARGLRKLGLTFFSGGIQVVPGVVHWAGLREVYLESNVGFFFRDGEEMMRTLGECVVLEECTLKFPLSHGSTMMPLPGGGWGAIPAAGAADVFDGASSLVTLPRLKYLCIDGDQNLFSTFHVTTTLAGLRVPELVSLEIYGRSGPLPLDAGGWGYIPGAGTAGGNGGVVNGGAAVPVPFFAANNGDGNSNVYGVHGDDGDDETHLAPDPLPSHEPLYGILQLLKQSHCPLRRLRLESVTLLPEPFIDCLRLAPSIQELVLRDHGWRVGLPYTGGADATGVKARMGAEDTILNALVVGRGKRDVKGKKRAVSKTLPSSLQMVHRDQSQEILAPNLVDFDVALCEASQALFCEFVESRFRSSSSGDDAVDWSDVGGGHHPELPEGTQQLRFVRCAFTAKEEEGVKKRVEGIRDAGLDMQVTFHLPVSEDVCPSAWTGIEGLY